MTQYLDYRRRKMSYNMSTAKKLGTFAYKFKIEMHNSKSHREKSKTKIISAISFKINMIVYKKNILTQKIRYNLRLMRKKKGPLLLSVNYKT